MLPSVEEQNQNQDRKSLIAFFAFQLRFEVLEEKISDDNKE